MRAPLFISSLFCGAAAVALAVTTTASCQPDPAFSGDELMGTFSFHAELSHPLRNPADGGVFEVDGKPACDFSEVRDAGFDFEGILSRFRDGSEAFFTVNRITRSASFDGQTFTSTHTAPRRFEKANCSPDWQVEETLQVALLSESQSRALSDQCDAFFADAGALPVNPDAGIVRPDTTPQGFDAIRACGLLREFAFPSRPDGTPEPCDAGEDNAGSVLLPPEKARGECLLIYRVTGVRKQ